VHLTAQAQLLMALATAAQCSLMLCTKGWHDTARQYQRNLVLYCGTVHALISLTILKNLPPNKSALIAVALAVLSLQFICPVIVIPVRHCRLDLANRCHVLYGQLELNKSLTFMFM
jgi:hypothetical protein